MTEPPNQTATTGASEQNTSSPRRPGAALSLSGLTKRYEDAPVVDNVSLEVQAGEFVTLLGPSGSGKTTTLNMIAGFTDPSAGEIQMDGQAIDSLPTHKRNIGVVFQHYALFPHMTVEQNVAYPLKRRGVSKGERAERVAEALNMVRLGAQATRHPRQLSGGQQQRVALARALVFNPRVLLMDEPLGALDKKLREWLQFEIKRLHQELGITFIYVTHDQEEALVLSDRVAVFNEGRIEQCASASEMYEHPKTLFVAEFLGESNVFRGRAIEEGGRWRVDTENLSLAALAPQSVQNGEAAALVVRPERTHVLDAGGEVPASNNVVTATVNQVVYLGSARRIIATLVGGGEVTVRQSADHEGQISVGDDVQIWWDPADSTLLRDQAIDLEDELEKM